MTSFSEPEVEQSARGWLDSLGWAVARGPGLCALWCSRHHVEHATLGASIWRDGVKL